MSILAKIGRRVGKYLSGIAQAIGIVSAVFTVLIVLGVGTAVFGKISNSSPLLLIGITIAVVSGLLFIVVFTFLHEITTKRIGHNPPTEEVKSEKTSTISTDTISYPTPPPED